nr:DUF1874 domain-containing protein [Methylomarinum sp. Ch1-1]MDP4521431.1 DUF1874 domain-containing protein [Methylomarinum sp. Ch1-1]
MYFLRIVGLISTNGNNRSKIFSKNVGDANANLGLIFRKQMNMVLYIINTPVLTEYGLWEFSGPLTINDARSILETGFVSAIGHAASANVLSQILNVPIPANRIHIKMQPGDQALILRLPQRLPEGKVLDETELKTLNFELGLLKRLK